MSRHIPMYIGYGANSFFFGHGVGISGSRSVEFSEKASSLAWHASSVSVPFCGLQAIFDFCGRGWTPIFLGVVVVVVVVVAAVVVVVVVAVVVAGVVVVVAAAVVVVVSAAV